jgi:diadenosine tetraphosphate (Ap4A) HIT family hydrolase
MTRSYFNFKIEGRYDQQAKRRCLPEFEIDIAEVMYPNDAGIFLSIPDLATQTRVQPPIPRPPMFTLDPRLEASSIFLTDLALCQARLQADARWPWIVLIPRRGGLRELEELDPGERNLLTGEIVSAGRAVRAIGEVSGRAVEKLNVGALGNVVAQLHIHVVGRRRDDPAWPGPVWGFGAQVGYDSAALESILAVIGERLKP